MILSEAANKAIELARKVREYYETELPKRHPKYPIVDPNTEGPPPPPEEKELSDFLAGLPDELIYQLLMVMYLGRGTFSLKDLPRYREVLQDKVGDAHDAVSRILIRFPALDWQLEDGLEELHKNKINVDKLPLKKPKAGKR